MAKDIFDISDDAWGMPQEAVKEFTDREDPQEAFERKFRVLNENWKKSYYVLCYYGIGGIGKTSFINKLCRVIRGVEGNELRLLDKIDCNHIRYDFDAKTSGADKLSILLSFRKQLGDEDKNFKFFRFDSAVLLYAKKSGSNIERDETAQSLLEKNPWLDAVVSTVGAVPVVGWLADIFQAIDKSAKTVKESISKYMDEACYRYHLNEINGMEMSEILGKLHEYFILDMRYNMQHLATKPMIIFLDTYERYVDTLNREISMITEDHWLRKGNRSVIRSIPGVLWVITGREKLYWAEDDAWDETAVERPLSQMSEAEKEALAGTHLEQHLLGDLSPKDATSFLKKAGICNDVLCIQLYKLTNGTPLFLDICVDTYHELCGRGTQLEIDQFGEDLTQLISRYLSNMSEANREMTYFLACLGTWDDESVRRIVEDATVLRWYTHAKYEDFVKHSFVIKNQDGSYYMHETVRSASLKNADKEILEEIGRIKLSVEQERVVADTLLDSNAVFAEYTKTLTENYYSYEEFYQNLKTAKKKFDSLHRAGSYDVLYKSARELFFAAVKEYPNTGVELIARSEYGNALRLKGFIKEALEIVIEISLNDNDFGVDEEEWLIVKSQIAKIFFSNGVYQEGMDIEEQILEERIRIWGEDHPDTLVAMNDLAISYDIMGESQKALDLHERTLEIRKRVLGKEHFDTMKSMNNLAVSYGHMGEGQKALELRKQTLELMKRVLGEEHPNTLTSMNNLANSYDSMGERQKALELKEQIGRAHV